MIGKDERTLPISSSSTSFPIISLAIINVAEITMTILLPFLSRKAFKSMGYSKAGMNHSWYASSLRQTKPLNKLTIKPVQLNSPKWAKALMWVYITAKELTARYIAPYLRT